MLGGIILKNSKEIGKTPMIKINYRYNNKEKSVLAKLEYYNLTGSIKDRVAFYIINNEIERGDLKDNMPIIDFSFHFHTLSPVYIK